MNIFNAALQPAIMIIRENAFAIGAFAFESQLSSSYLSRFNLFTGTTYQKSP